MDGKSSNLSYENIESTRCVRVCKAVLVSSGPGSENSPKACGFFNRQIMFISAKTICTQHQDNIPLFAFSSPLCNCSLCVHCVIGNKLQTFISEEVGEGWGRWYNIVMTFILRVEKESVADSGSMCMFFLFR